MSTKIQENIKTPNYVELWTSDFSTSTKTDRIISSIMTMSSMQEFSRYRMNPTSCGIPAISMQGTEDDWKNLLIKIESLEELLHPIREQIRYDLPRNWWDNI